MDRTKLHDKFLEGATHSEWLKVRERSLLPPRTSHGQHAAIFRRRDEDLSSLSNSCVSNSGYFGTKNTKIREERNRIPHRSLPVAPSQAAWEPPPLATSSTRFHVSARKETNTRRRAGYRLTDPKFDSGIAPFRARSTSHFAILSHPFTRVTGNCIF
jgi:hypothetical protein